MQGYLDEGALVAGEDLQAGDVGEDGPVDVLEPVPAQVQFF
jgi:hypothetical protein